VSWEERAVYYPTLVTNLAGEAFEALDEAKWSRRDCTEYQDKLDWEMRAFCRISSELEPSEMLAKMLSAARPEDRVNQEFHQATGIVDRIPQAHEGRPRKAGRPTASHGHCVELECPDVSGRSQACRGAGLQGVCSHGNRRSTLRVSEILGQADRSSPGTRCLDQASCVRLSPREAEKSVTSAWKVCMSGQHPHASWQEAGGSSSQAGPVHHSKEIQGDYCPALFQVPQVESTTGGDS
jgi:hypothetical protein